MHKGYGTKLTKEEREKFTRYEANATNPIMNLYLKESDGGGYYLTTEMKLLPYIFMFIPVHLTQLVLCIWDGGLKTFEINPRLIMQDYFSWGSARWIAANKILKIYEENEE